MSESRISQIETLWSVVRQAHREDGDAREAQQELLQRYDGAIRRYLLASLRDESAVDEVYQDFAMNFVRGKYQNASPDRGRFRNFLKTVLFRLVADYYRKQNRNRSIQDDQRVASSSVEGLGSSDEQFTRAWRDEMLKQTWDALASEERESNKPWCSVLRLRVTRPKLRSTEMASILSEQLGRPVSSANTRVLLHRARERFSNLLIDVVTDSLESASNDQIEEELADLGLLQYCQDVLKERRSEE